MQQPKRVAALFCAATLGTFAVAHAEDPMLMPEVSAALERMVERGDARAIAVGSYVGGKTAVKGFGRVGRDDASLPNADTLFEIGSITKVFTTLLAQIQVDADRLAWDQTLADRLPEQDFANPPVAGIRIDELASHTSGLPPLPDNMRAEDPMDPYRGYGRPDLLSFLESFAASDLEKDYVYSNLGVGLLGLLAADASGQDYADAIRRDVLEPLGMQDSGINLSDPARLAPGFSAGADMPRWSGFDALAGAGALVSSVDDLLRFIDKNLTATEAHPALLAIRNRIEPGQTAFGWHVHSGDDGHPVFWHNGGTGGYASFLAIRPDNRTGIVILSTSTAYDTITELGFTQITGKTADHEIVDIGAYPGAYRITKDLVITIFVDGNRLFAQATGQAAFPLTPDGEHTFVFPAADLRITFDVDASGTAQSLALDQAGQTLPGKRVADQEGIQIRTEIALAPEQFEDYVGDYRLTAEVTITVVARDGQLYARLTGQPAFPVFPYEPDRFFYKLVDAQLHFERNRHGTVDAVVLHQAGEQRAPRIE